MTRVVSLLSSATEILCALGQEDALVGRSHECDFPSVVRFLPQCSEPRFPSTGSSGEIDTEVKSLLAESLPLYKVDAQRLSDLRPDLIITQDQCKVCAVSSADVELALVEAAGCALRVLSLEPHSLADALGDIQRIADALGVAERGIELRSRLNREFSELRARTASLATKPTVACIEWIDPLMAAGNWVPELIEIAGGVTSFGEAGKHSPWMTWEALKSADPEVIVFMPCGFDIPRALSELSNLSQRDDWSSLCAVRSGRIAVTDGNQFFNRPGPRLLESAEILAEAFHRGALDFGHTELGHIVWPLEVTGKE